MRPGNLGHRLHPLHVQDAQIGLPAVELEQWIVIGTDPRRQSLPGDGLVEHAAEPWTIASVVRSSPMTKQASRVALAHERSSKILIRLTIVLVVLTLAIVGLTTVLIVRKHRLTDQDFA